MMKYQVIESIRILLEKASLTYMYCECQFSVVVSHLHPTSLEVTVLWLVVLLNQHALYIHVHM